MKDEEIARSLQVGCSTVERVRRRCMEEGVEAALGRREQLRRRPKKLDGQGEAHLTALALENHRRDAAVGRRNCWRTDWWNARWCEISRETVRQTPKKPTQALAERMLCIPPQGSAEFVCHMENVLEVYHRQYGVREFLVCLDETSKKQVQETPASRVRPGPGLPGPMIMNINATA